ncbi:uncharacterized protein LOC141647100 [Silene latifolia]|uniref:uncharacterized protein LOC141647100 n=1 Tax=Silene latifolia TaxID=37657 RepID=UPI003D77AF15
MAEELPNHTSRDHPTEHTINGDTSVIDANIDKITDTNTNTSTRIIANGISSIISSVITDFDSAAASTSNSQHHLSSSLDRLTSELDQLLEDAPLPFIMQHAAKLSNVRKRVSSLNSVLRSIQRRLDNIDRMLSVGVPIDQTNAGALE